MHNILHSLKHHAQQFFADVRRGDYVRHDGEIILRNGNGPRLVGIWHEGVMGQPDDWRSHKNLIVDEGILKILGLAFYTDVKINTWYVAPFSGTATPAAGLTAATFTATQTEIVSTSEGYTETPRQTFVPAAPAAGKVTNTASKAQFTIATATALTVRGAALLSLATRGGTTGVLASCVKYGTARVLNDTDVWGCAYEVSLTDS